MASSTRTSRLIGQVLPTFGLVAALGLSGCGGGSDDVASDATADQGADTTQAPSDDPTQDPGNTSDVDSPDPVAILPFEVDVPSGFTMLKAQCDPGGPRDPDASAGAGTSDTSDDEPDYSTWITYAVPDSWEAAGHGSGGSGSVTGTDEDRNFRPDGTGDVEVSVDWDNRDFDGNITDNSGGPWESFDYSSSNGEVETTITYENVGTVRAGDQDADLFYLDPAQAPDLVSGNEYKVRLNAFELPKQTTGGAYELEPQSFVVTIGFNEETTPVDQETVEAIVESFVLPECSWDSTLLDHELLLNLDLNGDGHIRDSSDVQEEMKDMQEDLEKQMDELRNESSDG